MIIRLNYLGLITSGYDSTLYFPLGAPYRALLGGAFLVY